MSSEHQHSNPRSRSRSPVHHHRWSENTTRDRPKSRWDEPEEKDTKDRHRSHRDSKRESRRDDNDRDDGNTQSSSRRRRDENRERELNKENDENRSKDSRRRRRSRERSHEQDVDRPSSHRDRDRERNRNRRPSPSPPPPSRPSEKSLRAPSSRSRSHSPSSPPPKEKEKPNYNVTTHLISETNTLGLKYAEPADARLPPPSHNWQLFVFKGDDVVDTISLNSRTCWLLGRDPAVADVRIDHPSCSKQHAVLQFRFRTSVNEWGDKVGKVRPYIIDLESANGTYLNKEKIEGARHFELHEKDLIKFGHSTREYVLMLETTKV